MARDLTQNYVIKDKGSAAMRNASRSVNNDLSRVEAQSRKVTSSIGAQWTKLAGVIAASIGVGAMVNFGKGVIQLGDRLDKLSQQLGVSVEWLDKARQAANLGGTSMEVVGKSLNFLTNSLRLAEVSTSEQAKALSSLNLSVSQLKQAGPEKSFELIAKALTQIEDPLKRNQAMFVLLGRSAGELVPILNDAASGWGKFTASLSEEQAESMARITNHLTSINEQLKKMAAEYLPKLERPMKFLDENLKSVAISLGIIMALPVFKWLRNVILGIGATATAFFGLGKVAKMTATEFARMAAVGFQATPPAAASAGKLATAWLAVKTAIGGVVTAILGLGAGPIIAGIVALTALIVGIAYAWNKVTTATREAAEAMKMTVEDYKRMQDLLKLLEKEQKILKEIAQLREHEWFIGDVDNLEAYQLRLRKVREQIAQLKEEMGILYRGKMPEPITITPSEDPLASYRTPGADAAAHVGEYDRHRTLLKDQETVRRSFELTQDRIDERRRRSQEDYQTWLEKERRLEEERAERLKEHLARLQQSFNNFNQFVATNFASGMLDMLDALIDRTKSVADAFRDMLASMARDLAKFALTEGFKSIIAGAAGGNQAGWGAIFGKIFGFASGGRMKGGQLGIVGEKGPELFMPDTAGTIIPNHKLKQSGGSIVNYNISVNSSGGNEFEARRTGRLIADELNRTIDQRIMYQRKPGGILRQQAAMR